MSDADGQPRALSLRHPWTSIRLILTDRRFRYLLVGGINTVLSMALFVALG